MTIDALNCPFCGGAAHTIYSPGNEVWPQAWKVGCKRCDIYAPGVFGSNSWHTNAKQDNAAESQALAAWNKRTEAAVEAKLLPRIAELEAQLLKVARMAEDLKQECGDQESFQAIRNTEYMAISYTAREMLNNQRR
jgi:hypothetical protein